MRCSSSSSTCTRRSRGGGTSVAAARPPPPAAPLLRRRRRPSPRRPPTLLASASSASLPHPTPAERAAYCRDTLGRMVQFCGPALLVPMSDPLMGFTDVVCVGQFASTAELSALGPATLALSFATYAFQAVQVATLALVSERLRARDSASAQRALSTALWVALSLGALLALPLVVSPGVAAAVVASTGCDPALRPLAEAYVRIRAAGLPFVLATMVAQAALLAQRDSRTPACAVVLGVVVNVLGNLVAVAWLGLGLAGAAGTTVLTQACGALALAALMWRQTRAGESAVAGLFSGVFGRGGKGGRRRRGDDSDSSPSPSSSSDDDADDADDPMLPPMPPLRPLPRRPTAADARALGRTVGPLSVAYVCRNLCYLALQGAAASLDVTRLAAHQAAFSCWNILSFVSSPVEQSALAFVPAAAAQAAAAQAEEEEEEAQRRRGERRAAAVGAGNEEEPEEPEEGQTHPAPLSSSSSSSSWWRVDATVRLVLLCGLAMGLGCGALAAAVPSLAPRLFTPDSAVWPWMRSIAPQAFLSMLLIGIDVSCAGCLLAGRDLAYVARSYVLTLGVLWFAVLGPPKLASTLAGVWWCLVLFFAARAAQSTARLGWLMRRRALISRVVMPGAAAAAA